MDTDVAGRKPTHENSGCSVCKTSTGCVGDEAAVPCDCPHHTLKREISPFRLELAVRRKALQTTGFPDKQVNSLTGWLFVFAQLDFDGLYDLISFQFC